jgi:hypothetical protein
LSSEAALQEALAHHQAGRLTQAERIYERTLASEPRHAGNTSRTVMLPILPDDAIAPYFNRLVVDAPEPVIPGGALNPDLDAQAIEAAFHSGSLGFTQFDNLRTVRRWRRCSATASSRASGSR